LAHCDRCPAFQNPVFSSSTHHPGLAGIVKKRNKRWLNQLLGWTPNPFLLQELTFCDPFAAITAKIKTQYFSRLFSL
jgi:hypothetical protein